MKHLLALVLIFILFSCDFKSSEDYHKEANKLEQKEKFKDAIDLLDKAIEKDPQNISALLDRAVDKSYTLDYKGAIDDYSRVLDIDSDNTLALFNRGKNKKRLENFNGAIIDFNEAISTIGGENIIINRLEIAFRNTGYEFDVTMEEIKFERGIAYYKIDSLKLAFKDFNFSIKKNHLLSECYFWKGLIYLRYNKNSEGCNYLNKSKELGDPDAQGLINKYCN